MGREDTDAVDSDQGKAKDEAYNKAFWNFLRVGREGLSPEDAKTIRQRINQPEIKNALGSGSTSTGGAVVPTTTFRGIVEAQKAFGGLRSSRATVLTTGTGEPMPIPTDNDTDNKAVIVGENNTLHTDGDPEFNKVDLNVFKYSSKIILVPLELLQDSVINLEQFLSDRIAKRMGRGTNYHFTVGDASGEPGGLAFRATLGATAAVPNAISYDDLVELQHSVDPSYRAQAEWMMNDSSLKIIKKLKDEQDRPLWLPGLAVQEPDSILGRPYIINQDMAEIDNVTDGDRVILFGDMSTYWIRDVDGMVITRLNERYADTGQVGFVAISRHGGNLIDGGTHPVKYLTTAAA